MANKVFIPITDELMYDYPELITSELTPYQVEHPCFHWSASIETSQGKIFRQVNSRQKLDLDAAFPDHAYVPPQVAASVSLPVWARLKHKFGAMYQKSAINAT